MTSDPKAIQHIFSNTDTFEHQANVLEVLRVVTGPGLVVALGDVHRRQRRVMQPAFGIAELKAICPVFSYYANEVAMFKFNLGHNES
jgi:cytochrome P450